MLRNHLFRSALLLATIAPVAAAQSLPQSRSQPRAPRTLSLGVMALAEYEGDGVGVAAEWPVARLSPTWSVGLGGMTGVQHNAEPVGSGRLTTYRVPVMGVANLQYQRTPDARLALYSGVTAGVTRIWVPGFSSVQGAYDERGTHQNVGMQFGARYHLANRIGLMTQIGVGGIPGVFGGAMLRW